MHFRTALANAPHAPHVTARRLSPDPEAHRLVYQFNHQPDKFSFDALLAELGHKAGAAASPSGSGGGSGSSGGSRGGSSSGKADA